MPLEYIEINSAYRNRVEYPLASDFIVRPAESGAKTASQAIDPYSLASPLIQPFVPFIRITGGVIASGQASASFQNSSEGTLIVISFPAGTASQLFNYYSGAVIFNSIVNPTPPNVFSPLARIIIWDYIQTIGPLDYFQALLDQNIPAGTTVTINDPTNLSPSPDPLVFIPTAIGSANTDNFYIGQFLYNQTRNQWLPIAAYDGTSHVAALNTSGGNYTPGTWQLADTYLVRPEIPMQFGQTLTITSPSSAIIVPPVPNSPDGSFIGNFIRLLSTNTMFRITGYTAGGNIIVNPSTLPFPSAPLAYEMLQFTADNESYLIFSNSYAAIREPVCYDISLVSLILPSQTLNVGNGSRSIFYPYFYVEFRSLKNSEAQGPNTLISNNPNSRRATFRSTITDYPDALLNPFIRLGGDGMVQRIKLDPLGSYKFKVTLPDGTPFKTIEKETFSPYPPNRIAQITALFSIERVTDF